MYTFPQNCNIIKLEYRNLGRKERKKYKMLSKIREKSQITIPKEVIKKLGLKTGDNIDISIEDNKIVIKPIAIIPKDQAWFWSKEWQKGEKQAEDDIKNGKIKKFNSSKELFDDLDN